MTNEGQTGGVQEIGDAIQRLGMGERLAVLGAAGVFLVWVVFGVITQDYGVGQLPFLLALGTLVLAYRFHVQKAGDWPLSYGVVVLVLAAALGLVGVRELVLDLRYQIFDTDAGTMVGAVLFWIAALAAGVGAVQMARE